MTNNRSALLKEGLALLDSSTLATKSVPNAEGFGNPEISSDLPLDDVYAGLLSFVPALYLPSEEAIKAYSVVVRKAANAFLVDSYGPHVANDPIRDIVEVGMTFWHVLDLISFQLAEATLKSVSATLGSVNDTADLPMEALSSCVRVLETLSSYGILASVMTTAVLGVADVAFQVTEKG